MTNSKKRFGVYFIIIALQLVVMLYWAGVKTNFYIDELYSMERAVSYSGNGNVSYYIPFSADWKFNEWVENSAFKKYLIQSDEESLTRLPFLTVVKMLITGRAYNGFLSLITTAFGYNVISARPGIALNMILLVLVEIMLLIFMKKLDMSFFSKALALCMFGFSGYVIGLVEYVRFYLVVIFLLLAILDLFYIVWTDQNTAKILAAVVGIFALTYLSFSHSELTVAYFGAFLFCFLIALALSKKWKRFFLFIGIFVAGIAYVVLGTDYLDALIRPGTAISNPAVVRLSSALTNPSMEDIRYFLTFLPRFFADYYFGSVVILLLLVFAVSVYFIYTNRNTGIKQISVNPVTLVVLAVWLVLLLIACLSGVGRTPCAVITVLLACYTLLDMCGIRPDLKKIRLSENDTFIVILVFSVLIYTAFSALEDFSDSTRYYFYGFVGTVIVFWYFADWFLTKRQGSERQKGLRIIVAAFAAIIALAPFLTRNVEYIYEEDNDLNYRVEQLRNLDVVLYVLNIDGDITTHETYDCIYQMSDESRIYAVDLYTYDYVNVEYPEEFLLWSKNGYDIGGVVQDLRNNGYNAEYLGTNHISVVYHVEKSEKN